MHSQSVNIATLANICSFYERVRKRGRGVLRCYLAVLTLVR